MSDEKLRELERRWKETRAVEDEVAYLLERVRAGDLTQERLELAARCGHRAAQRAFSPQDHDLSFWWLGLHYPETGKPAWSEAALRVGSEACFRVCLAIARAHAANDSAVARAIDTIEHEFLSREVLPNRPSQDELEDSDLARVAHYLWPVADPAESFRAAELPDRARDRILRDVVPWVLLLE